MADSTLTAIRAKVRRLTRSPSTAQITDSQIDEYVNTFVAYDFPEHLRLFNLRETFSFVCNPYQDTYPTDIAAFGNSINPQQNSWYNFRNNYISVHPPLYIAGYQGMFSQSREQFFAIYPMVNSISTIGTAGDGTSTSFSGTVNASQAIVPNNLSQTVTLLQNNVLFSSVDINGNGAALKDVPVLDQTTGNPTTYGNLYVPGTEPSTPPLAAAPYSPGSGGILSNNYINYVTGQFVITFPVAPANGQAINSQTVPSIVSLPQSLLFYDNTMVLRPVPDQPYTVQFEVYVKPTQLLSTTQSPDLQEWWQYISYGAAKKVFEDRMDMDSVQLIMPEFKKQEALILRRTLVQYSNDRTATIYTEQTQYGPGWNGWGWGGGNF